MAKIQSKNLKQIGWMLLIIYLARTSFFKLVEIDFLTIEYAIAYRKIWFVLFPLASLLVFIDYWKRSETKSKLVFRAILISCCSFVLVSVLYVSLSICEWSLTEPLYKSRTNKEYISGRYLNCGALDSDNNIKLVKVKPILHFLYTYDSIDTKEIEEQSWIKTK